MTKLHYDRGVLELVSRTLPSDIRDEMALPSYLHKNPAVRRLLDLRMSTVLGMMDLRARETLLDFGCGAGLLFLQMPPRETVCFGVDLLTWPSQMVLDAHGRSDVTLLDATNWERNVPDNSLDCIAAVEVLEHVENTVLVAQAFLRKLKPMGRLIVSGPTESPLYVLARAIAGFSGHYHRRNIFSIMNALEIAGFVRDKSTSIPMRGPGALFVIGRFRKASC